ncbi:hypothetical protein NDU88_002046 [Pleurodeles waltl]|uniref:Uncharacterized protein n=1 Tax=Pleurodeles waltl TaxID=8319 RepID=A0AAV7NCI6_PLEWA|nr:hypothetical protein NDU88_002046 [Pleurodeles waltl]
MLFVSKCALMDRQNPLGAPKAEKKRMTALTEEPEGPVARSFLEALFTSLQEDLQAIKKDLSSDLQEVCRDLDAVGERDAKLERKEDDRNEEIEWVKQEILHLQALQIELQYHTED